MSVILEFSIAADDFQLGRVLTGPSDMHLELERLVPTGDMMMPFVWVTGSDHDTFANSVHSDPSVADATVLDTIGESALYRIEWEDSPKDLIEAIAKSDAVILEAQGDGEWVFRLRFPNHENLSDFHNYVISEEIPVHIDRTYTLTETTKHGHRFDLTEEQREALVLALRRGYFETPSDVSLEELADELGISRQALSNRIRRGNEKVLRGVLLSSVGNPGSNATHS